MRSSLFQHPVARALLGGLLAWSFFNIFLVAGLGAGTVGSLIVAGLRPDWRVAQGFGWAGLAAELGALGLMTTGQWRRVATVALVGLLIAAALFLLKSDDLKNLQTPPIAASLAIFAGAVLLRAAQLRMPSRGGAPSSGTKEQRNPLSGKRP